MVLIGAVAGAPVAAQNIITTAVGSDLFFQGNGKPATSVPLGRVQRLTVDSSGRPVFADPNYNLVFRVNADGTIQTIAGNNVQGLAAGASGGSGGGYSGDGGPATSAALNQPQGTVYDSAGNLYIADTYNNMVRVVSPQGVITRFAGTGPAGYSADGTSALNAMLSNPTDLAMDSLGNLYLADSGNAIIRKISPQGALSTVAGNRSAGCSSANNVAATSSSLGTVQGMALDAKGNLYFSECGRVREVSGGTLTTVALGGAAAPASLIQTAGLAFDSSGNLLIVDEDGERIYRLSGGSLTSIAGTGQAGYSGDNGPATSAMLQDPFGLAVTPAGLILVADLDNLRVRQIDTKGVITTIASNGALISGQNGVSAALATLYAPYGLNFDASGAMLIADTLNNIVRRMGSNQTLATVAGTGTGADTGNSGPATQSPIANPVGVTADGAGDLFLSESGRLSTAGVPVNNIRKVNTSGTISTLATLAEPYQTVLDTAGNLYAADFYNGAVVRISSSGTQQTVISGLNRPVGLLMDLVGNLYVSELGAGRISRYTTGPNGFSSTPTAIAQNINGPAGMALDNQGNLYFAAFLGNTVGMVGTNGKIATIAGTDGVAGYAGDNGPASGALLNHPFGLSLTPNGLFISDVGNNRIREILIASAPTFTVSVAGAPAGASLAGLGLNGPANGAVVQSGSLQLSATLNGAAFPGLLFSVSADQPWITVTPSSGAMPAQLVINADPTGLPAQVNTANVTVSAPGANPATVKFQVAFNVAKAQPSNLCTNAPGMSFAFTSGASAQTQSLGIENQGGGSGSFSIATCGAPWLSVSPSQGSVTATTPASVNVTVDPSKLTAGTALCNLTITGGGYCGTTPTTPTIPVSASLNTAPAKLQLSLTGLSFPAVVGGGAPLSRTFGISNAGQGSMAWTASASTTSGGSWLSISPASGTVTTPLTQVTPVTVSVNPSGLSANTYYGSVTVTPSASNNAPQSVTVVLTVAAAGSSAASVDIYPAGLAFVGTQGAANNPSSQTINVANLSSGPLTFSSSGLTSGGDSQWFVVTPASASIAANQSISIVVQPNYANLSAGSHQGTIALRFSDGSTATATVQGLVQASTSSAASGAAVPQAQTCVQNDQPQQQPWNVTMNQPTNIQVLVTDTCNNPLNAGNTFVRLQFPTNTAPTLLNLSPSGTPGMWEGSWTPTSLPAAGTNLVVSVESGSTPGVTTPDEGFAKSFSAVVKAPATAALAPAIATGGVLNAASNALGVPLAPCSLVSIYGSGLATGTAVQDVPPLQTVLAGSQLQWSQKPLSLLAAQQSQINAQVPCDLTTDQQLQITVNNNGALSEPQPLPMADYSPAIFTADQSGQGQGAILDYGPTGVAAPVILTSAPNPVVAAHAGDIIAIFCTGLGAVNPAIGTGQPAGNGTPGSPLSFTTASPTVTIGGINAPVSFSGMAPGFAGLYQVNVTVPSGITPGTQVPIVMSIGGFSTTPYQNVTMAIQ